MDHFSETDCNLELMLSRKQLSSISTSSASYVAGGNLTARCPILSFLLKGVRRDGFLVFILVTLMVFRGRPVLVQVVATYLVVNLFFLLKKPFKKKKKKQRSP